MSTTDDEMRRGRVIAERARRRSDLDRYVKGGKVQVKVALPGHALYKNTHNRSGDTVGMVNLFYVDGVMVCHENTAEDEYPSERVMATLALAVGATVGFEGIPDPEPTHKVSAEAKEYNRQLRARNIHRQDMQ